VRPPGPRARGNDAALDFRDTPVDALRALLRRQRAVL
jgi:hypothetical protein